MADSVTCDKCGRATAIRERKSGLRATVDIKHLSAAATSHTHEEIDLFASCTRSICEWMGKTPPGGEFEDD